MNTDLDPTLIRMTAQAHGLYLRLRDRLGHDHEHRALLHRAYERYERRVARLTF